MDFDFSADQLELKNSAIQFARKKLNGDMIARDKAGSFSRKLWKECAEFGLLSLPFSREYGGSECDIITTLLVMEGLGYGCKDSGLFDVKFGLLISSSNYLPDIVKGWDIFLEPLIDLVIEPSRNHFFPMLYSYIFN